MARVITFSRFFPVYHPKKGQPTNFIEKIWRSFEKESGLPKSFHPFVDQVAVNIGLKNGMSFNEYVEFYSELTPKHHTIRNGNRWKAGDYFSPRVWSGKPYASPMITIAPDIKIEKVWDISLRIRGDFKELYCNDEDLTGTSISKIAMNDGLTVEDLFAWFNKPFTGQIICWNKEIEY